MKALSLWQPWAQLVVWGQKRVETRTWMTSYSGPLLIHASAAMRDDYMRWIETDRHFAKAFAHMGWKHWSEAYGDLPFGALIGQVNLHLCLGVGSPALRRSGFLTESELAFGDYSYGRYAWLFHDPVQFEHPIPYRGRQRLFNVPDEVVKDPPCPL